MIHMVLVGILAALVAVVLLFQEGRRQVTRANDSLLTSTLITLAKLTWWLVKVVAVLMVVLVLFVIKEIRSW